MSLIKAKQIVIKVGSSILLNENGGVNKTWLKAFSQDIEFLKKQGTKITIVTSGAVALGRSSIGILDGKLKLEEKQAAAACGQIKLVEAWREALAKHDINIAQILLTIDDSENRKRYINARNTLSTLLANNVIPVINENDTVATMELRVGDNDRLAARVAQMIGADHLILFSDIDGLYTSNPSKNKNAKFINKVEEITPEIEAMAGKSASNIGTGGMVTKIEAAKIAIAAGCNMVIAKGNILNPLKKLIETNYGTWFIASSNPSNARKNWIIGSIAPAGVVIVDEGAEAALKKGKSLLPAGVKKIQGDFEQGDCVIIKNDKNEVLGRGLVSYSSEESSLIIGQKSHSIEKILGFSGRSEIIHRDNLVIAV
ncbi:MAG: glutamate 5-kinase [Pseudomonadota bacterium]